MVTGGIAPNLVGRLEPKASQLSFSWQVARHRLITDAVHARRRQDRAADPARRTLRVPPAGGRAVVVALADQPVPRARPDRLGRAQDDRRLRALRGARAARRLRRRRDHGLRGLPHQPVHRAADQSPRRRMGRLVREPHPLSGGDRAPHARGGRAATSSSSTGCRCSTWSKAAARGTRWCTLAQAVEAAGATIINTGIGWHEARIPTIAHDGAARRVRVGDAAAEGRGEHSADHDQPHQRSGDRRGGARARRRRHGVDGAAVPGRRRISSTRRAAGSRRRDQHLHRLQPGVPRPHLRARDRVVPRQSVRVPRDRC